MKQKIIEILINNEDTHGDIREIRTYAPEIADEILELFVVYDNFESEPE